MRCMDVTLMHLLEKPCTRCGHQCAVHTGGASPEGWAIYEPIWANAWGWCMTPDCECPQREGDLGEADEYKPRALGGRSPVGDIRRRVPPARRATPTPLHDHGATASVDAASGSPRDAATPTDSPDSEPIFLVYDGARYRLWHNRIVLDWHEDRARWGGGRQRPCRFCRRPCLLIDGDGRPVHKVCLELATTAGLLTRHEERAA